VSKKRLGTAGLDQKLKGRYKKWIKVDTKSGLKLKKSTRTLGSKANIQFDANQKYLSI
jgi:hypothetical protein